MHRRAAFGIGIMVVVQACSTRPEVHGSSLPLNMQPARPPRFAGAYDFDLLDAVQGHACITRSDDAGGPPTVYWFAGAELGRASDPLTNQAIGAAAFDAVKDSPGADSLVITRVLSEGHGPNKVCATVYGRGIKLRKADAPAPQERRSDEGDLAEPDN
jgi:hypothetical protein